jgi:predicted dehydrogenase
MKIIVIGLGVQGHKRKEHAGDDCIAVVDPFHKSADYPHCEDVPLLNFDAALICTPDTAKFEIIEYLLANKKHVLVEKPLLAPDSSELLKLSRLAEQHSVTCYTAYNHRFEPHFMRMQRSIEEGILGQIYSLRMFYGNGTARLVRNSAWRDQGTGVLPDLGSHLLDTLLFWIGKPEDNFRFYHANCFENKALDHCSFGVNSPIAINLEMTLLSWRNHFTADIYAENGSAHIQSLCKWGPSQFTIRDRKLPSGRPDERSWTLIQPDPTWKLEYDYFKGLCQTGKSNLHNDLWINETLNRLTLQLEKGGFQ